MDAAIAAAAAAAAAITGAPSPVPTPSMAGASYRLHYGPHKPFRGAGAAYEQHSKRDAKLRKQVERARARDAELAHENIVRQGCGPWPGAVPCPQEDTEKSRRAPASALVPSIRPGLRGHESRIQQQGTPNLQRVDGGWSKWFECSQTCGGGHQTRSCTAPPPSGGGYMCFGEDRRVCNTKVCTISDDDDDDDSTDNGRGSKNAGNSGGGRHKTMTVADQKILQQMEDNAATDPQTEDDDHQK